MPDLDNFDAMVQLNHQKLFRFLLSSLGDRDLAETLTQECLLKAYKARATFQGKAQISTWLTAIAVNLVRDHFRSRRWTFWKRIKSDSIELADISEWLPDRTSSAEAILVARAQVRAVSHAVSTLPSSQRTVFLLRYVEEFNLNEIGQSTGMSVSKVKSQLHRALTAVRQQLGVSPRTAGRSRT